MAGVPVIGTLDDLPRLSVEQATQIIYIALARSEWQAEERALQLLSDSTASVRLVPDLSQPGAGVPGPGRPRRPVGPAPA